MAPSPFDPKAEKKSSSPPPEVAEGDFDGGIDTFLAYRALNDLGNSERLIKRHGEDLRYVRDVGWAAWDGCRWGLLEGGDRAQLAAQETARAIRGEITATAKENEDFAKALGRWARDSGGSGKIAAMQREARPHLTVASDDLDSDPFLFNAANGTLELGRNIGFRPHAREDLNTRISPVAFDRDADCPAWRDFLDDVMPAREVQEFLQAWYGYSLTGDVSEQVLAAFIGTGRNGKSTMMEVATHIAGDYALKLPFASLLHNERRGGGDATPDLAQLPGARMVTAAEPDVGARFSESILKEMTGGEPMSVRHLNHDQFKFYPQFKLTMGFNNRPSIRDATDATWRRLLIVPFDVQIAEADVDKHLKEKLLTEAPGILNWMLEGTRRWFEGGLGVPDAVRAATRGYRQDSDPVGNFLAEMTIAAPNQNIRAAALYAAYERWAKANAQPELTNTAFGRTLGDKRLKKETIGVVFYMGLEFTEAGRRLMEGSEGSEGWGGGGADPGPGDGDVR